MPRVDYARAAQVEEAGRAGRPGKMTFAQWVQSYQSWRGSIMGLASHKTLTAMDKLFARLSAWVEMQGDPPPGMIYTTRFLKTPRFEGFFVAQNTGFLR